MRRIITVFFLMFSSILVQSQNVRFALQMGAAKPLGDFAKSDIDPEKGGFATTGFNMDFVGERIFTNKFVVGVNLGYNIFGIDQDALKSYVNSNNPELVTVETQAFQNFNLQFRGGYNWNIDSGNFHITPFVDFGLGLFNSAYYAIQNDGGDTYLRKGNSSAGLLITPGLDITFMFNSFMGVKLFGSYQIAGYSVDEEFQVIGGSQEEIKYETVDYNYNSLCFGMGLNIML